MLARYPAMSLQVVAKIYAQTLRLKLKGAPLLPPPRGEAPEGVPLAVGDRLARTAVRQALRRVRAGRIEVVEGGRRRAFGPAGAELRATVTIHDPAAWRGPLRGSVGLGETYVDGLWETDDLVALIRIAARELRQLDGLRGAVARPRGLLHRARRLVPENTRDAAPAAHRRPLRPRQRPLRRLPRRADDLLVRLLPASEDASLEEAQLAKLERICAQLRLGPENHLLEIGTGWGGLAIHAAREHGCRVTTTTISAEQHELAPAAGPRGRASRTGSPCCSRTTATSRPLRPAGLGRDDRGGRLAVLRRLLPPLQRAAQPPTG